MAATSTAVIAGTAAIASYLDAKYHIRKDVGAIRRQKAAEKSFAVAAKEDRRSLWYNFENQVSRLPAGELAIWSRAGCYTWQETHRNSCCYAQFLLDNGVERGQLVSLYLTNSADFIFAVLACWSIGCAPALINHNLGEDSLIHCLKIAGSKVLLVDEDAGCRQRIEAVRDRIEGELGMRIALLDSDTRAEILQREPSRPQRQYRQGMTANFPMCLMYTSGSTGLPKGCPFPLAAAWNLGDHRIRSVNLQPCPGGDRWYNCMPLYHGTGFTTAVTCMISGMTFCIGKKFSVSRFWDDIRESDATAFVYVGETARYLLAAPPTKLDKSHKVRVMFGNGLRPDVWARFQDRFGVETVSEFFNSTEGIFSLTNVARSPFFVNAVGHHGALLRRRFHDVYIPVEVDFDTNEISRDPRTGWARRKPYEEGGEILVALPSEAAFGGYWNNPKATAEKFVRDVFRKGDLFYRTGDALRRLPDGRWYFMDRLGDTFRWKSENVATAEVAEVLGHYPGINEAIVYGVQVPGHDGRAGCAAIHIAPEHRASFSFPDFLAHCRRRLPKYAVPVFLRIMQDVSPMHNNKQNKGPLKKEGIDLSNISGGDKLMWLVGSPSGLAVADGAGPRYEEFGFKEMETLKCGDVKL